MQAWVTWFPALHVEHVVHVVALDTAAKFTPAVHEVQTVFIVALHWLAV